MANQEEVVRHIQESSDSSQKVYWGIVSTANIGKTFVAAFHASDYAFAQAVGSRDLARSKEWAEQNSIPRAYGSYEEVINDPTVTAIYVPVPTAMHAEWTIKAAEAGKHVLCEKPLASTFDEAVQMAEACSKNGVKLMDGVMWSHHLKYKAIKRSGDFESLGKITHCNAHFSWPQLDPNNIRLAPELEPTGCLGDLGWYTIRACLFAFSGELPVFVSAAGMRDPVSNAFVEFHALFTYEGGRYATMGCSFSTVENQVFEVHGANGTLRCQDFVWAHDHKDAGRYHILRGGGVIEERQVDAGPEPFRPLQLVETYSKAIVRGESTDQWTILSLKTQAIHDAVLKSASLNSAPVYINDYIQLYPSIASSIDII